MLQYPQFDRPFVLTTDSSDFSFGCVLSQGEPGNEKPVAYASKGLSKSEISVSIMFLGAGKYSLDAKYKAKACSI